MNALVDWLRGPTAERLGWTLLHFVWQGTVWASLFAGVRYALRRRSAQARYLAGCLTLLFMVLAPLATFQLLAPSPGLAPAGKPPALTALARPGGAVGDSPVVPRDGWNEAMADLAGRVSDCLEASLPWLVALWLGGCFFCPLAWWPAGSRHNGFDAARRLRWRSIGPSVCAGSRSA